MRPAPLAVSVTKLIPAPPTALYELISDITLMSTFSPETIRTSWLDGDSSPRVGARFKGTNAISSTRWSTKPVVTAADSGVRFAFKVPGRSGPEWVYEFATVDGGTMVTESMRQDRPSPLVVRLIQRRAGVRDRAEHLRQGMITTLERLAAAAADQERLAVR